MRVFLSGLFLRRTYLSNRKLSLYRWFCYIRFHWFFFKFLVLLLLLLYYSCLHLALSLVFYSTSHALILLYHVYFLLDIACYLYLVLYACAHDTIFDAHLWFRFIDTRVLIYVRHLAFAYHSLESSESPESSCPGLRVWSLWILLVADQSSIAVAWIIANCLKFYPLRLPARLSSFPSVTRKRPFVQFIIVYLFVFSHLCLSVM